jgi:hypothetical protein
MLNGKASSLAPLLTAPTRYCTVLKAARSNVISKSQRKEPRPHQKLNLFRRAFRDHSIKLLI